jgi:hypothetical protein
VTTKEELKLRLGLLIRSNDSLGGAAQSVGCTLNPYNELRMSDNSLHVSGVNPGGPWATTAPESTSLYCLLASFCAGTFITSMQSRTGTWWKRRYSWKTDSDGIILIINQSQFCS